MNGRLQLNGLPLHAMRPVTCRHLVGVGILSVVTCVIRFLSCLVLLCFWVLPSTFYTLLAKANDLLFASFASFNNVRLGFMPRSALRGIAFHLVFLVALRSCYSLLGFVRHNYDELKILQLLFPNVKLDMGFGRSISQFYLT